MDDLDKMSAPAIIEPVKVTVIAGTGTGDGSPLTAGLVVTPDHQPNIIFAVISPLVAIAIRFVNSYLTALLGFLLVALTPEGSAVVKMLGASDFIQVVKLCGGFALAPSCMDLLKNLITVFGKLEGKYPLLTGSV